MAGIDTTPVNLASEIDLLSQELGVDTRSVTGIDTTMSVLEFMVAAASQDIGFMQRLDAMLPEGQIDSVVGSNPSSLSDAVKEIIMSAALQDPSFAQRLEAALTGTLSGVTLSVTNTDIVTFAEVLARYQGVPTPISLDNPDVPSTGFSFDSSVTNQLTFAGLLATFQTSVDQAAQQAVLSQQSIRATYNEASSTLTLVADGCEQAVAAKDRGAFIGNGKVGAFVSYLGSGLQQCLIAGDFGIQNGTYKSNSMETFRTTAWQVFSNQDSDVVRQPIQQTLNMRASIVTSDESILEVSSGNRMTVSCDTYAPRQLPFCTMQTVRMIPMQPLQRLLVFQEHFSGADIVSQPEYTYSVLDVGGSIALPLLKARGVNASGDVVCCASAIMFEDESMGQLLGFNIYRDDPRKCYVKLALSGNLLAGQEIRVHSLTAHMTGQDFEDPEQQCQAVLLSVLTRKWFAADGTPRSPIHVLREQHVAAWTSLWNSDVRIEPKPTALLSAEAIKKRAGLAEALRKCIYHVHCSVRDGSAQTITPGSFSALDPGGSLVYDGDLFLMPLLLLIAPGAARSVLEFRAQQLQLAQKLATAYGLSGAKYPHDSDVVSLKGTLYWETSAPSYLFNSALVSLGVWNYFRLTRDREWLGGKGYGILRNVADFYISRAERDATTGAWRLSNVVALNKDKPPTQDNAFTNNLVKLSLRAAIEASHELGLAPRPDWSDMYTGLSLPIATRGLNFDVVLYDAATDVDRPADESKLRILEPLLVAAMPQLWDLYMMPGSRRGLDGVARCADYYAARLRSDGIGLPINYAALAAAHAAAFQHSATIEREIALQTALEQLANHSGNGEGRWSLPRDITSAAALPLVIASALGGAMPQGGVAEARFYYQEMKMRVRAAANLPRSWSSVVMTGLGPSRVSSRVSNQLTTA